MNFEPHFKENQYFLLADNSIAVFTTKTEIRGELYVSLYSGRHRSFVCNTKGEVCKTPIIHHSGETSQDQSYAVVSVLPYPNWTTDLIRAPTSSRVVFRDHSLGVLKGIRLAKGRRSLTGASVPVFEIEQGGETFEVSRSGWCDKDTQHDVLAWLPPENSSPPPIDVGGVALIAQKIEQAASAGDKENVLNHARALWAVLETIIERNST